jgi:hypothetical protein
VTVVTAVCSGSPRSPWDPRCKWGRRVRVPPQRLNPTRPGRVLARYSSHLSRWPLPPRRSAQLGVVDPVQLPALALADAPEYSAAATVTARLSIPTRDTPVAMRSSDLLARGQPRGYKPSAPFGLDHPGLRRVKRASSLRSPDCNLAKTNPSPRRSALVKALARHQDLGPPFVCCAPIKSRNRPIDR